MLRDHYRLTCYKRARTHLVYLVRSIVQSRCVVSERVSELCVSLCVMALSPIDRISVMENARR